VIAGMTVTAQDGYRSAAAGGAHLGGTSLMRDKEGAADPPVTAPDSGVHQGGVRPGPGEGRGVDG
jgi:hypothetical protein